MEYLFVALGGSLGAVARLGVIRWAERSLRYVFPFATFVVNATGSFMAGFLFPLFAMAGLPDGARLFLATGFLGAYTTFSAFSIETVNLFRAERWGEGFLNLGANVAIGLAAAAAGWFLGRAAVMAFGGPDR